MRFTNKSYLDLLSLIDSKGYVFTDYHNYKNLGERSCCIIRHDIDNSIEKAYEMFRLEQSFSMGKGVSATYFVLMTSNFYNPASAKNIKLLRTMYEGGANIGLHFDEKIYMQHSEEVRKEFAEKERTRLEDILQIPIQTISMHRPEKSVLDANWQFDTMENSYSDEFFHNFKYLSDSRRKWREPVLDIIENECYKRLHILVHPFWYNEQELNLHDTILQYILLACEERYNIFEENITDFTSILPREEANGLLKK